VLQNIYDIVIVTDKENFNPHRCLMSSNIIHTHIYSSKLVTYMNIRPISKTVKTLKFR